MARILQFHYNVISWKTELKTHFKSSSASLNIFCNETDGRERKVIYKMEGSKSP